MKPSSDFSRLQEFLHDHLLNNIVPWWLEHAIDWENGGICTFIEDDGTIVSTDKYMWSQLRALYTFSKLYNEIEPRDEWMDVAHNIYEFVSTVDRDDGDWPYWVNKDGEIVEGATSIYSDGFAIMGMTEYARATGEQAPVDIALDTYEKTIKRLKDPASYETAPYKVPRGGKAHGVSMIFSNVFHQLGSYLDDDDILDAGYAHTLQVMDEFRRPGQQCLLEYIGEDGSLLDVPEGRAVCPGHAIESMWFQMHVFEDRGESHRIDQCIECIRWHVDMAWDPLYGGLRLARDCETGDNPAWAFPDSKWWWVHTETMYALLLAYEHSAQEWCLDWYDDVHEWTFSHYPHPKYREWRMRLQRDGSPEQNLLSLIPMPVKDPFHTPRALIYCIQCLERINSD